MPGVVHDHVQPPILFDDFPYRGIHGFLRCDIEFDGAQVRLMRRRKFLDSFHLSGIAARCFAHTGVHRVPRLGQSASCQSAKPAGCARYYDHLFHWGYPLLFASVNEPAVHLQHLRINPAALGPCQEGNHPREVLRLAEPLQRIHLH
jgi:hypothetical protein